MQYVCIQINTEKNMIFAGTNEPCALIKVASIGKISVEENKIHTKNITEFITKNLGLDPNRYVSRNVFQKFPICHINVDKFDF